MNYSVNFCTGCGARFAGAERFCTSCGQPRTVSRDTTQRTPQGRTQGNSAPAAPNKVDISTNPIFFFAIAQVISILLFHVSEIVDNGVDIGLAFQYGLPSTVLMALIASPVILVGFVGRFARDISALAAVVVAGLILFARDAMWIFEDRYGATFLWVPHHLLAASAIAASVLAAIQILKGSPFESLISPTTDWWRIPFGVLAGVFLMFEYPGRVLQEDWRALSLMVVALGIFGTLTTKRVRVGLFAGLGIAVAGSIVAYAMRWIFDSDFRWVSFVSIPSLAALACCAVIVIPDVVNADRTSQ